MFLLSFDTSDQLHQHLPKLRKAPVVGCHQTSFPLLRWVIIRPTPQHLSVFDIFTLAGNDSAAGEGLNEPGKHVLGLLTVRVGVKDTIGIPPWISPQ